MNDRQRQILQEFEVIKEKHTGYLKETKENIKDQFSFSDLKNLLEKRRNSFDYRITRMLNSYGYVNINIRYKLDRIWNSIDKSQPAYKKWIRPLAYVFPFNFVTPLFDDTSYLKLKIWTDYVNQAEELLRKEIK
ncbi:MAG TPA: hypothetical protein VE912_23435 [Bacteroidales bacterium]|nr:hypothetical protein [Bacteroidales bacterium]